MLWQAVRHVLLLKQLLNTNRIFKTYLLILTTGEYNEVFTFFLLRFPGLYSCNRNSLSKLQAPLAPNNFRNAHATQCQALPEPIRLYKELAVSKSTKSPISNSNSVDAVAICSIFSLNTNSSSHCGIIDLHRISLTINPFSTMGWLYR